MIQTNTNEADKRRYWTQRLVKAPIVTIIENDSRSKGVSTIGKDANSISIPYIDGCDFYVPSTEALFGFDIKRNEKLVNFLYNGGYKAGWPADDSAIAGATNIAALCADEEFCGGMQNLERFAEAVSKLVPDKGFHLSTYSPELDKMLKGKFAREFEIDKDSKIFLQNPSKPITTFLDFEELTRKGFRLARSAPAREGCNNDERLACRLAGFGSDVGTIMTALNVHGGAYDFLGIDTSPYEFIYNDHCELKPENYDARRAVDYLSTRINEVNPSNLDPRSAEMLNLTKQIRDFIDGHADELNSGKFRKINPLPYLWWKSWED